MAITETFNFTVLYSTLNSVHLKKLVTTIVEDEREVQKLAGLTNGRARVLPAAAVNLVAYWPVGFSSKLFPRFHDWDSLRIWIQDLVPLRGILQAFHIGNEL